MNLTQTTSNQCSLQRKQINLQVRRKLTGTIQWKGVHHPIWKIRLRFLCWQITDQPSVSDVKQEPVFIRPENIAGPDPVDFCSYCSVSDYAVGTDADELV